MQRKMLKSHFNALNSRCGGLFVAIYKQDARTGYYQFSAAIPVTPVAPAVGELIKAMSPTFLGDLFSGARCRSKHAWAVNWDRFKEGS